MSCWHSSVQHNQITAKRHITIAKKILQIFAGLKIKSKERLKKKSQTLTLRLLNGRSCSASSLRWKLLFHFSPPVFPQSNLKWPSPSHFWSGKRENGEWPCGTMDMNVEARYKIFSEELRKFPTTPLWGQR